MFIVVYRKLLNRNRLACVELGGPGSSTDDDTGHTDICPSRGHDFHPGGAACCTSSLWCSYTAHTGTQRPALRHVSARRLTNEQDSGWDLKVKHIQQKTIIHRREMNVQGSLMSWDLYIEQALQAARTCACAGSRPAWFSAPNYGKCHRGNPS